MMIQILPLLLLASLSPQIGFESTSAPTDGIASPAVQNRVLVPVLASGQPGADGSVWDTDLWVTNRTEQPVFFFMAPCQFACCCDVMNTIPPQNMYLIRRNAPHGEWVRIPADGSLQLQARFRDRSRADSSAGVDLPLVREEDFRTDEVNLPGIPRNPRFRTMVRLYGLEAGASLSVEQLNQVGAVLQRDEVALAPPGPSTFGSVPAYAQLPLSLDATGEQPIRLRIRPLTEDASFWAFASVTNNETSEVTLVVPW